MSPSNSHIRLQRSQSSLTSNTTFHSIEPVPMSELVRRIPKPKDTTPSPTLFKPSAPSMARTDSGYEEDVLSSQRRSSSSRRHRCSRDPNSPSQSMSQAPSRPIHRRSANSTNSTSKRASRPSSTRRFNTTGTTTATPAPYSFFQFPTLTDPSILPFSSISPPATSSEPPPQAIVHPVPSTVHYWTSSETRRLEYAAIDAASRGIRGFVTKLVPDCILPKEMKVKGFSSPDGDDADDAGSVRRYRISLDSVGPEKAADGSTKSKSKIKSNSKGKKWWEW